MKKIHWVHDFEKDGWNQMGYTTIWRGKCKCGAVSEGSDISQVRGKSPTWKLLFMPPLIVFILANIFFYLYVNGIYPFPY